MHVSFIKLHNMTATILYNTCILAISENYSGVHIHWRQPCCAVLPSLNPPIAAAPRLSALIATIVPLTYPTGDIYPLSYKLCNLFIN